MATAYNVQLSPTHSPGFTHVDDLKEESAERVSELLMLNHAKYHTLFNEVGLHNHIVHHLCSLWALGATPSEAQAAYDLNKSFQLPHFQHGSSISVKLQDPAFFKEHLQNDRFYKDYLSFFQDLIAKEGVEAVVKEYVFKGDERADDILGRMYSGFEHPILHLGFGLEFKQPLLVAEALAAACAHDDWPVPIVSPVEKLVASDPSIPYNSYLSVLQSLKADPVVGNAVKPRDPPNRVTDGLMKRAAKEIVPLLAKWRVKPTKEDIEYRMTEMIHMCAYVSGAAQNPKKNPSMDFFLMHSTNLSAFYPTFMSLEWLSLEQKARLLTWKGWMDLVLYASAGSPTLYPDRITNYKPKHPGPWSSVISRVNSYPDDGHTSKLIRALLNAQSVSARYLSNNPPNPDLPLRLPDFLQIAHMTMDSVEQMLEPGYKMPESIRKLYVDILGNDYEVAKIIARWVRWCGVEGAWNEYPDLKVESKKEGRAML